MKLSVRLLILVLTAALPVLAIQVYGLWEERAQRRADIATQALDLARLAAAQQDQFVEGARYLLTAAAQLREVQGRDAVACSARMAEFRQQFPAITGIGAFTPGGVAFCTSTPDAPAVSIADRPYFQRVLRSRSLEISGYLVGRRTGRPSLIFAYPALDAAGEITAVLILAFDLGRLSESLAATPLPDGATMSLIDGNGALLARTPPAPEWIGRRLRNPAFTEAMLAEREGIFDDRGFDGVERVHGFVPLVGSAADLFTVVGLPWQGAMREADRVFWREMALIGLVFVLAAVAALIGGEVWIRHPVARLRRVVGRMAGGDLAVRAAVSKGSSPELRELAESVNVMAGSLEARQAALRASEERFRAVVETAASGIVTFDGQGAIEFVNSAAERLFGYRRGELIGRNIRTLMLSAPGPDDRCDMAPFKGDAATGGSGDAQDIIGRETTGRRRDGTLVPISLSIGRFQLDGRSFSTAIVRDITERKRAEERQRLLMAEIDHRAKNALATVQSMILLSKPSAHSVDDYAATLLGRLAALSRTHDLLAKDRWEGTGLFDLVRDEVEAYVGASGETLILEGEDVLLKPQAAQTLSLVLHELTTNAAKYGALRAPTGRVTVTSSVEGQDRAAKLVLRWVESGGPAVLPPARRGFGSTVIERSLAHDLNGTASLRFARKGLRCDIEVPLDGVATRS